jgi:hypothetical protein
MRVRKPADEALRSALLEAGAGELQVYGAQSDPRHIGTEK